MASARINATANVIMDIVKRLRELDNSGYQPLTGAIGSEAALEIERLRVDAGRYRFLRKSEDFAVMLPRRTGHIAFMEEALDEHIDAAMPPNALDKRHE